MNSCITSFVLLTILVAARASAADSIQLPVTKDNSIVLFDDEWSENAGQQSRIRIKGNQHIVAIDFNTAAIKGRHVRKATLICAQSDQSLSGVTISTIAAPWDETMSNGLTAGIAGIRGWGYAGAHFPAVMGGNGLTLVHSVKSKLRDGQYHWDVPPDMVHALAIGIAHGLAIHEHDANYGINPTIFAREQSGKSPYLLIELDDSADPPPAPPTGLTLIPVDGSSGLLTLKAPAQGFAYEVWVDGTQLGRSNIPLVEPGETQVVSLRDLPDASRREGTCEVQVVTLNRTGHRSEAAVTRGVLFKTDPIARPQVTLSPASKSPVANLSVIPATDKYDSTGKPVGDLPADYRTHNFIFDGQRVHLMGAAGEVIGFQMLLRGHAEVSVKVSLDDSSTRIDLNQALYVQANGRMIPDPLLPLPRTLLLKPDTDQAIFADIFIPFDAQPGLQKGSITISDGRVVPLQIVVLPFELPRRATFFCEMNGYGLPDDVEEYYALQRIAYDHRIHANILHYSHHTAASGARKSNLDMRLSSGRRMDNKRYDDIPVGATGAYWDDFVEAFGPFIDGSLFADGHRGPIPAPGFYLTFHESWPLNCRAHFNGDLDAFEAFAAQPAYSQTYVDILGDFARLAKSKNWTQTGFQVYFNNKGSIHEETKAPWILDEPSSYWDYRALRYYGELTDRGRIATPDVHIDYRIDISRPEFCRGQLDQRDDLWVVSSWAFEHYRRLVTDRMERDGLKAWVYGTSNHVHESNRNIQAWALDAWKNGATGVVAWQTIDKSGNAMKQADQLGLFIFDKDTDGQSIIRHSIRLKAYREAQQLIEYLNLLKQQRGWSQAQMRQFVSQYVELDAQVLKTDEADAGTTMYGRLSATGLESLKRASAELLMRSPSSLEP